VNAGHVAGVCAHAQCRNDYFMNKFSRNESNCEYCENFMFTISCHTVLYSVNSNYKVHMYSKGIAHPA